MFDYKTFYNMILKIIFTHKKINLQSKMSVHCFEFCVVVLEDCQNCCANCTVSYWDPFSLLSNGYWGVFTRVKELRHEVEHSTPSCAKVKNEEVTSSLLHAFTVCTGMYIQ